MRRRPGRNDLDLQGPLPRHAQPCLVGVPYPTFVEVYAWGTAVHSIDLSDVCLVMVGWLPRGLAE